MSIKTTIINPPQIFTKSQIASGVTPPLGVIYLASYLIKHGYPVQVIDALGENPEQTVPFRKGSFLRGLTFKEIIDKIDPDTALIGISNLFTFAYPAIEELCQQIHQRYPDKKIMLGGPHPSALYRDVLENHPEVDYVFKGEEGEQNLLKLVMFLDGKLKFEELTGIAFRDEKDEIVIANAVGRIKNLEKENLPYPARELIPMENYIKAQEGHGPSTGRWTSILTSRGCPYGCTFCESRRTKWVARSAEDVVDEMEECMQKWGITEFHFEDDNMTIDKNRIIAICDEIIKRKLNIKWQTPNGIRASRTDEEILIKMKQSGCMHITLAPESGSPRVLNDIIKKGVDFDLDQLKNCGAIAHKIGLKVAAYFILGMPGETKEDMDLTIAFAKELGKVGVDEVAFGLFIPLPGTPLWDAVEEKRQNIDFLDLLAIGDMTKALSWSDHITDEELQAYRKKAYLTFHVTRMLYHPFAFMSTFINVLRDIETTKTERTLRQYLKRFKIKAKKFTKIDTPQPKEDQNLNAYPYDGSQTMKVLMQNESKASYRKSFFKVLTSELKDMVKWKKGRPKAEQSEGELPDSPSEKTDPELRINEEKVESIK